MSFSFGAPSSAPANTSGNLSGFSFGSNKPATPGFGMTGAAQPSSSLFGSTPAATSAPAFGSTTPAFGASAGFGQTSNPSFGTGATPAFGATTSSTFGTGTTPAFGATSTAPAFGSTPAFGAASTAPAFGATSAAPTFGATTTPAFGAANTSFGGSALGAGGLNFGAGTNAPTAPAGLTLGAPTTASSGLGGLGGFSAQGSTLGGGLFAPATTSATSGLFGPNLCAPTVTSLMPSAAAPSAGGGLGGAAPAGGAGGPSADKAEPPKQSRLPNEIQLSVDSFKTFVKKQKSLSSEIMRVSVKPLHKVRVRAESVTRAAAALGGALRRARLSARRLRRAAAAAAAAADTHPTADLNPALDVEGSAPPSYVKELISELEQQLIAFKRQMEVADKQMRTSPKSLTEQEVTLGIRRLHCATVALAGRLAGAHAGVTSQKAMYLNLRKYVLKDPTDVFRHLRDKSNANQMVRDEEDSKQFKLESSVYSSAVLSDPREALGSIQQLAGPTPFTYIGSNLSSFVTPDASTGVNAWGGSVGGAGGGMSAGGGITSAVGAGVGGGAAAVDNSFQLQKPPGKRGKQ